MNIIRRLSEKFGIKFSGKKYKSGRVRITLATDCGYCMSVFMPTDNYSVKKFKLNHLLAFIERHELRRINYESTSDNTHL